MNPRAARFEWSTDEGRRAYFRQYEAKRRARCRRLGLCVTCNRRRAKTGRGPDGKKRRNCTRCLAIHARFDAAYKRAKRRRERALRAAA